MSRIMKEAAADFPFLFGIAGAIGTHGWARSAFTLLALFGVRAIAKQEVRRG